MIKNKRLLLVKRPGPDFLSNPGACFKTDESEISTNLSENTCLVQNMYISIDPTMRVWMSGIKTYIGVLELGSLMPALCVGRVIKSNAQGYTEGDIVMGMFGWQRFAVVNKKELRKLPKDYPEPQHFLGVFGINGLTAYFGLHEVGKIKSGDTVVVSTAAGSVGTVAVQLAKDKGCKVVGIAGGKDKCEYVKKELGADECLDYTQYENDFRKLAADLKKACPKGIDVYFDNVGGWILDAVLVLINNYARIIACGAIAAYNGAGQDTTVLRNYSNMIMRRAKYEGFIYFDYAKKFPQAIQELMQLKGEGKLKFKDDITEGLEKAPEVLKKLFTGKNTGKTLVKVEQVPVPKL
jgi:Putative NADP-dependent oxidoreductases